MFSEEVLLELDSAAERKECPLFGGPSLLPHWTTPGASEELGVCRALGSIRLAQVSLWEGPMIVRADVQGIDLRALYQET